MEKSTFLSSRLIISILNLHIWDIMGVKWVSFQVDFKRHTKEKLKNAIISVKQWKHVSINHLRNLIEVACICMRLKLSLQSFMGSEISLKSFTKIQRFPQWRRSDTSDISGQDESELSAFALILYFSFRSFLFLVFVHFLSHLILFLMRSIRLLN